MSRLQAAGFLAITLLASLAGCQASAGRGAVASAPPPPEQTPARPETSRTVSPFGELDGDAAATSDRLLANVTQHTFSKIGRDFDPDLSGDGQVLAYASTNHNDRPDIFLKAVDGFAITQLTADPADDVQPKFSPDGERVIFCSNRSGNWDVWLVNRDGTGLTQVTSDRADEIAPCWSPDGRRVAFSVWGSRSQQWEIWSLALDRPGVRRFLAYGLFPAWSPDGQRLAFQRARQRGTRWFSVWVVDITGEEARFPTEIASGDDFACIAPRWSPNGRVIVYSTVPRDAATEETVADLWTVDTFSGVRRKLSDGGAPAFNPAFAAGGRVYFVSTLGGSENIWSVPGDDNIGSATASSAGRGAEMSHAEANAPADAGGH
ncbi:MAG: hypothetical protein AMXMBFR47_20510 [Planctomycetota bacterium]